MHTGHGQGQGGMVIPQCPGMWGTVFASSQEEQKWFLNSVSGANLQK